jgi:hypothetical protein
VVVHKVITRDSYSISSEQLEEFLGTIFDIIAKNKNFVNL